MMLGRNGVEQDLRSPSARGGSSPRTPQEASQHPAVQHMRSLRTAAEVARDTAAASGSCAAGADGEGEGEEESKGGTAANETDGGAVLLPEPGVQGDHAREMMMELPARLTQLEQLCAHRFALAAPVQIVRNRGRELVRDERGYRRIMGGEELIALDARGTAVQLGAPPPCRGGSAYHAPATPQPWAGSPTQAEARRRASAPEDHPHIAGVRQRAERVRFQQEAHAPSAVGLPLADTQRPRHEAVTQAQADASCRFAASDAAARAMQTPRSARLLFMEPASSPHDITLPLATAAAASKFDSSGSRRHGAATLGDMRSDDAVGPRRTRAADFAGSSSSTMVRALDVEAAASAAAAAELALHAEHSLSGRGVQGSRGSQGPRVPAHGAAGRDSFSHERQFQREMGPTAAHAWERGNLQVVGGGGGGGDAVGALTSVARADFASPQPPPPPPLFSPRLSHHGAVSVPVSPVLHGPAPPRGLLAYSQTATAGLRPHSQNFRLGDEPFQQTTVHRADYTPPPPPPAARTVVCMPAAPRTRALSLADWAHSD